MDIIEGPGAVPDDNILLSAGACESQLFREAPSFHGGLGAVSLINENDPKGIEMVK